MLHLQIFRLHFPVMIPADREADVDLLTARRVRGRCDRLLDRPDPSMIKS
jgi:hypothetical protein